MPGCATVRGQHPDRPGERSDADRDVDQEHQPPPDPPQVGLDQRAGQDRRGEDRETHHRTEGAEHLGHLLVVEDLFEHPESLGDHQRPERALQHPEDDQHRRRRGDRTGRGHHREAGRPDQEQPAAAEHVAEPGAGDQEHGEGQRVAGGQPLQGGGAAAEGGPDRRAGDVDDRRVHEIHDVGGDHDREHEPAHRVAGDRLPWRRRGHRQAFGLGHRSHVCARFHRASLLSTPFAVTRYQTEYTVRNEFGSWGHLGTSRAGRPRPRPFALARGDHQGRRDAGRHAGNRGGVDAGDGRRARGWSGIALPLCRPQGRADRADGRRSDG